MSSISNVARFQIGKSGVTPGTISALNALLKTHKHVRISALRSSGRNRESIKAMANALVASLEAPCECAIIGFTIVLRRRSSKAK